VQHVHIPLKLDKQRQFPYDIAADLQIPPARSTMQPMTANVYLPNTYSGTSPLSPLQRHFHQLPPIRICRTTSLWSRYEGASKPRNPFSPPQANIHPYSQECDLLQRYVTTCDMHVIISTKQLGTRSHTSTKPPDHANGLRSFIMRTLECILSHLHST
jgi:hypothetical protein